MKTLSAQAAVRPLLFVLPLVAIASSADAAMTAIWRTNNNNGTADSMNSYATVATLAGNSNNGSATITGHGGTNGGIANARYTSIFGDFTQGQTTQGYIYKTVYNAQGRVSQIVRYEALASDPMANFRTGNGQVFNLTSPGGTGWDREDDFFADGLGNFYRNGSTGNTTGVTKYTSFNDLVSNTNGTTYSYSNTFGYNDRFFAFEGKFYRTNTGGPNGSVSSFATYNSFSDLLSGTVASTTSSQNWSSGDIFIPVPAPGALALLGLAGLAGRNRRR